MSLILATPMSLNAPQATPTTRENIETCKRDARGLLEAIARAVQEGRAAGQRLTSGSLAYTVYANTEAEFQVNLLMTEFQKVFLGQRPGDQSFRAALTAELTRWGIQNSKAHPINPLISQEMDRALDALYESFAATLGVPPVAAAAPATVAELPVAEVAAAVEEVCSADSDQDCSTDMRGGTPSREECEAPKIALSSLYCADPVLRLTPGEVVVLATDSERGRSLEIGPGQQVRLTTNSSTEPTDLLVIDTFVGGHGGNAPRVVVKKGHYVFTQHADSLDNSRIHLTQGGVHTVVVGREDRERRRLQDADIRRGEAYVQVPGKLDDVSRGEHVRVQLREDGTLLVTDLSKHGTRVAAERTQPDARRSEEAVPAAVLPAAVERPAASRRPQPRAEPVRAPARRRDDYEDDDRSSGLSLGSVASGFVLLASAAVCCGGPIYARPPAEPGAEPAVLPIAPTPLQVLCEGGIPVTYKFKKEKGKTDVFKDGEEGVYQFALIDGGVVVAALAGSVPESCFDGKMPASFTDFRNVELVVTKAVRYVIPNDLSFDKDIARYAFEPAFQPRVETCPEKLPFPEWYTNGPYYQTILKPDGSFVLQTIDVALHKNLGWTATDNRLKTANTWLYVNEGTTQGHPSCGGYKHDVNALEGMSFINKLAHSNRSKFDLY